MIGLLELQDKQIAMIQNENKKNVETVKSS